MQKLKYEHKQVCVSVCTRKYVCLCSHEYEKLAIPFANIDMGVPIQSCYKVYCLSRSHFIRLKHTPHRAHAGFCSASRLLASLLGWQRGGMA